MGRAEQGRLRQVRQLLMWMVLVEKLLLRLVVVMVVEVVVKLVELRLLLKLEL